MCTPQHPEGNFQKKKLKKIHTYNPEFHKILQKAHDYKNYAKNKTLLEKAMSKNHFGLVELHDKKKDVV